MIWTRAGAVLASAGILLAVTAGSASAGASSRPASRWQGADPSAGKYYGTSQIRNNVTCPCGGSQVIWADSRSHWGVTANYPDQPASISSVSYPGVQVLEYNSISKEPILQGIYDLSQPPNAAKGAFAAAFDVWIQNNPSQNWTNATLVSVWVDNHGLTPPGSPVATGDIYGKPFSLYAKGKPDQGNATYTLLFANGATSGVAHLAETFTWLRRHGWISPNAENLDVEAGWLIQSTGGVAENFEMKSFLLNQPGSTPYGAAVVAPRLPVPLIVGLAALFLAVFGVALLLLGAFHRSGRQRTLTERIEKYGPRHTPVPVQESSPGRVGGAAVDAVSRLMRPTTQERLSKRLDIAGVSRRPAEWALLGGCLAVVVAATLSLVTSFVLIGVLGGALIGWLTMRLSLSMRILRRRSSFSEQLPDLLQLIASALQSGFSLPQAFDAVVREDSQPAAGEFARALAEARLGADLEDALDGVANRMDSDDMRWTVLAIRIQQGVGGNLAEVLLTIAGTIRERAFLRRQVSALSAEGRLSAYILVVLPLLVAAWLFISSPAYMRILYTTGAGRIMLLIAVALLAAGALWMRRTIKVEV
jgi:Flp pilus assembly protein TadB